jgi:hypothetical protein
MAKLGFWAARSNPKRDRNCSARSRSESADQNVLGPQRAWIQVSREVLVTVTGSAIERHDPFCISSASGAPVGRGTGPYETSCIADGVPRGRCSA